MCIIGVTIIVLASHEHAGRPLHTMDMDVDDVGIQQLAFQGLRRVEKSGRESQSRRRNAVSQQRDPFVGVGGSGISRQKDLPKRDISRNGTGEHPPTHPRRSPGSPR